MHDLRYIEPYYYQFKTFAKQRWFGQLLVDVFTKEFGYYSTQYYTQAVDRGNLCVNGAAVPPTYRLKGNDVITHTVHRHEPPVLNLLSPQSLLFEDQDYVVINKPPSIPVHPCGSYFKNSVTEMIQDACNVTGPLHLLYRLDRLTSGVLVLAKNSSTVKQFRALDKASMIEKMYLAKVAGNFVYSSQISVKVPIKVASVKLAVYIATLADDTDGKASETLFRKLSYDEKSDTSIVECIPITGRTHQIRLHLQYLGYPIHDDPLYGRPEIWGPDRGKGILSASQVQQVLSMLTSRNIQRQKLNERCTICHSPLLNDPDIFYISLHAARYKLKSESNELKCFNFESLQPFFQ